MATDPLDFNHLLKELQETHDLLFEPRASIPPPKKKVTFNALHNGIQGPGASGGSQSIIKVKVNPLEAIERATPPLTMDELLSEEWDSEEGLGSYDDSAGEDVQDSEEEEEEEEPFQHPLLDDDVDSQKDEDFELGDDEEEMMASAGVETGLETGLDSAFVNFQSATLEDYEDMDGLLDMLDKYLKKNRNSFETDSFPKLETQSLKKPLLPIDLSPLSPANLPPNFTLPDGSDTDSDEEKPTQKIKRPSQTTPTDSISRSSARPNEPARSTSKDPKTNLILAKLQAANVRKVTTRIYIQDSRAHHTLSLTSLMTADQVIQSLIKKASLEATPVWTLFEMCNDNGLERPMRSWEIVTDVIAAWDIGTTTNAIVLKKYAYHMTMAPSSITGKYPTAQGYLFLDLERGKWQKRFCFLKGADLFFLKDAKKPSSETFLCSLKNFDCYTLSRKRRRKMPTDFAFALRSTQNKSIFERPDDYCHFVCVEKQERLFDWVLALRLARTEHTFDEFPEVFEDLAVSEKARKRKAAKKDRSHVAVQENTMMHQIEQKSSERRPSKTLDPANSGPLLSFETTNYSDPPVRRSSQSSIPKRGNDASSRTYDSSSQPGPSDPRSSSHRSHRRKDPIKEGEVLRSSSRHRREKKPLVNIPGFKVCPTCGCTEFRAVFTGSREGQCGNCYHQHS